MERRKGKGFRGSGKPQSSSSSSSSPSSYASNSPQRPMRAAENPDRTAPSVNDEQKTLERDEGPSEIPSLIGACPDMCPERERAHRERLRDLAVFERLNGNPRRTSANLAVKKFCRTISTTNMQALDIRPLPVLQETLEYLFKLMESSEYPFDVVHDFVFDRTRSIRQDLGMQNIINDQVINMYERMVEFHIISNHKLPSCNGNPNISSLHYLNMEQLVKSLVSLYELYGINRRSNLTNENEAEFYSFYVLLHLGSDKNSTGESLSLWFRRLGSPIVKTKEMCFARSVFRYCRAGNFKRFFSTIAADTSYLQFCLLEPSINEFRARMVSYINNCGYKLHPYPLVRLAELLMMKESEVESLCNACGLETKTDEAGMKVLPTKQMGFHFPKGGFQNYSFLGLERLER
eukprot:TRINITY_DN3331_c1_g1_i2.p1 TRINITY_DN3331_c1_g1~~TRINITY_DN3331_c1_g1_i2.p1  ORF type:complete len:405 (+),score=66.13 TRINITY_DN3331_c1_g1_i2:177-1391(+)